MTDDDIQTKAQAYFFQRLKIDAGADERTIKRAYARELKLIDQAADPAGFQDLREAYEAALYWVRTPEQFKFDGVVDELGEIGRAANELQWEPAAAGVHPGAEQPPPAPAHPDVDPDALAQKVFAEFEVRSAVLDDLQDNQSWERELKASLADERLIHLTARHAFEQRIADLLAQGWRPGHHALFVAAAKVFEWESDARRVHTLGAAGYTLHFALDQRAMVDNQSGHARLLQRQLITRLRDATPPTTRELIDLMPVLATVEARFPTWLALNADADNVSRWHNLNQLVPSWRRWLRRRDFQFSVWPVAVVVLVLLRIFSVYNASDRDDPKPQSIAEQHLKQGNEYLDNDQNEKAVISFDQAISQEPGNASAYAGRAMALIELSEKQRALADLVKLESLLPLSPVLFRARGLLAEKEGRYQDSIEAYSRSIGLDPRSIYTLMRRGYVYKRLGRTDEALHDADLVLQIEPGRPWAHLLRARVFKYRGDIAGVKAEAATVLLTTDTRGNAIYYVAATMYEEIGDRDGAVAAMDKAVAAAPVAASYLRRSLARPMADVAARRSDIETALKLEPASPWGLLLQVRLELPEKRWDKVIAAANRAVQIASLDYERQYLMTSRGIGYAKRGEMEKASEDFKSAKLAAKTPSDLNTLCYEMAVYDVALQTALDNCNASLEKEPNAWQTQDSKAFTLLRMKRYREALVAYDIAVGEGRKNAAPLYGRGVVKYRLGNRKEGQVDIQAALAASPDIGKDFAQMGLAP